MKLVTPISNLFQSEADGDALAELSDSLELRPDLGLNVKRWGPITHCHISNPSLDINFQWAPEAKGVLQRYFADGQLPSMALTFHLARDFSIASKDSLGRYVPSGKRVSEEEMLNNAVTNCEWVRAEFGLDVYLENNNFYPTGAYDIACRPDFISEVVSETGSGFLFDYAHAQVSAINMGLGLADYIGALPLSKIAQMHISQPILGPKLATDAHGLPTVREIQIASKVLESSEFSDIPITIEFYGSAPELRQLLASLRSASPRDSD